MIAATILLYGRQASGTLLGVSRDPVGCLGVVLALLDPFLNKRAGCRQVVVESTAEAEFMAAFAANSWHDLIQLLFLDAAFDSIFAIWSRTPSKVLFVVNICSC
jgi:hypothetical protein